jgi:hypothetical protein
MKYDLEGGALHIEKKHQGKLEVDNVDNACFESFLEL